jgi:hypothetical protein
MQAVRLQARGLCFFCEWPEAEDPLLEDASAMNR